MKSNLTFMIFAVFTAMVFTACEPNTPKNPKEPVLESYPKKHLIEEFTGQACGYCPYGMDCIHEFMGNDTNWVLILHHYGYKVDNYSVKGSKTITSTLGVSGAPSMAINRAKTNYGAGKAIVFHPGYLEDTNKSQFEETTYASIRINNSYDEASRELTVRISGVVAKEDVENLKLTVLVKESGMIGTQADYYGTYEGWQEFRHANAVRAFLSDPKGDAVTINEHRYSDLFVLTLDEKWNAENCMVVAFLSEDFQPVVQAEQKPIVSGTTGGADILHGGITRVPVEDYYPEPSATASPAGYSGNEVDTMTAANAYYSTYNGMKVWEIQAYNSDNIVTISKTACIPFVDILLLTESSATKVPAGTYPLNLTEQPGTVYAGYRDDELYQVGGSTFYFISKSYFDQDYLVPAVEWLIVDGEMTVTEDGWELSGHARNGAAIHLKGSTPIVNRGSASSPAKMPKNNARTCVFEKKAVNLQPILDK